MCRSMGYPDGFDSPSIRFQPSHRIEPKRKDLVGLGRFELPTHGLGNRCSIHLSYRPAGKIITLGVALGHLEFNADRVPGLTRKANGQVDFRFRGNDQGAGMSGRHV